MQSVVAPERRETRGLYGWMREYSQQGCNESMAGPGGRPIQHAGAIRLMNKNKLLCVRDQREDLSGV